MSGMQWKHGHNLVPGNPAGPQMTECNTPRAIRSVRQSCHSTQLFFLHRLKSSVESLFLWGRERCDRRIILPMCPAAFPGPEWEPFAERNGSLVPRPDKESLKDEALKKKIEKERGGMGVFKSV